MPPINSKNFAISPAASDLGLGDMVRQQLEDQENERKKKLAQMAKMSLLGGASNELLGMGAIGGVGATGQ